MENPVTKWLLKCFQNLQIDYDSAYDSTMTHCSHLPVSAILALYLLDIGSISKSVLSHSADFHSSWKMSRISKVYPSVVFKQLLMSLMEPCQESKSESLFHLCMRCIMNLGGGGMFWAVLQVTLLGTD